ncbi:transcriptional regulator [Haloferax namakaokahaiae]|uniref:Transcriptional regulator n=1 Tax=Haloferax namakaokahaiae TaxID=1748331 RepID=A0ABD5ZJA9_9EURY
MGDDHRGNSRDEGGRWSPQFEDGDFLDAVTSLPVASTQRVADEVGCSYDLAYRRLKELEKDERVESEKVGGAFVWLIVE